MGEARRKDLNDKALAFAKTDRCIFCGGAVGATTADHCPPRSIFYGRRHPEGYVFPACLACNAGSRISENWVALLSRMNAGSGFDGNEGAELELRKLARPLLKTGVLRSMQLSANRKRALARRAGLQLADGETYAQLALMGVPPEADAAVGMFAAKLGKALHFMHTGRIVPSDAGIAHRWYTNFNEIEGKVPPEIFTIPAGTASLRRARVDLSDQFNYRYAVADTGELSMFTVWFRSSFCILILLTFKPSTLERLKAETEAEAGADTVRASSSNTHL